MLVLAIAAVIIVMSVRYYQSASAAQRANACLSYLQAVVATADSLSEATQSYSTLGSTAEASKQIDAIVPRNEAVCNSSETTIGGSMKASTGFYIHIKIPTQACLLMLPTLKSSGHWTYDGTNSLNESQCNNSFSGSIYYSRASTP